MKAIRVLFVIKILFLILFLLVHQGVIRFGEAGLFGQDPASSEGEKKNKKPPLDPISERYKSMLLDLPKIEEDGIEKDESANYLKSARGIEAQLKTEQADLEKRLAMLRKIEKQVEEKIVALDKEKKFILNTLQDEKEIKADRLNSLVAFYGKMEPKKAGPVFEKMDKDLLVAMFNKMKKKQVTKFLEAMAPDKALEISQYFARLGSAKEYDMLKEINKSLVDEFAACKKST